MTLSQAIHTPPEGPSRAAPAPLLPPSEGPSPGKDQDPGCNRRQQIDEWILPLRAVAAARLDAELGARLRRIAPMEHCLCVLIDHDCAGLDAMAPRLHGTMAPELQRLYATLIAERDPLLACAGQEWRALAGTIEEHCTWIQQQTRNADVIRSWLEHVGASGAVHLVVVPARGWLSRGALFAFFAQRPSEDGVFALFYAAQRLAVTLELRYRPYTAALLAMRFTARELQVLRAGLQGVADEQIAHQMGLSVATVRYYFKKFKHRVPPAIGHLKPRELARIAHHLGKL
ncbi:hypothetical protein SBBP1_590020 [Burkholderiales bacterium]|nr:hypothetical protein SBBP1_590020 [Burkholderiales bacterium]